MSFWTVVFLMFAAVNAIGWYCTQRLLDEALEHADWAMGKLDEARRKARLAERGEDR